MITTRPGAGGLVIVDKPAGWSSHDVVSRIRRIAGTKRVGHAGTLDPMATGVLVLGVERATRVLGYLTLRDKSYDATIRLGQGTVTDDAEGEPFAGESAAGLSEQDVRVAVSVLTGDIEQVPPQYSAVKVGGQRSYKRARQGESIELGARTVTVREFRVTGLRWHGELLDVDASLSCTSGTYVRALARDLGERLGVGGHLTMLRRTRVGPYTLAGASTLDALAGRFEPLPLADAVADAFPRHDVSAGDAARVAHGGRLPAAGFGEGPFGVFGPGGSLLALMTESGATMRPLAVFAD